MPFTPTPFIKQAQQQGASEAAATATASSPHHLLSVSPAHTPVCQFEFPGNVSPAGCITVTPPLLVSYLYTLGPQVRQKQAVAGR